MELNDYNDEEDNDDEKEEDIRETIVIVALDTLDSILLAGKEAALISSPQQYEELIKRIDGVAKLESSTK